MESDIAELETATTKIEQPEATEQTEGQKDDISKSLEMEMVGNCSTQFVTNAEKNLLPPASPAATTSELFGGKKRTSSPSPSFMLPQEKRLKAGDSVPMMGMSAPQLGPGASERQPHVRPNELLVLPHGALPAVNGSRAQFHFPGSNEATSYRGKEQIVPTAGISPGGINADLKTAATGLEQAAETKEGLKDTISVNMEKDIVENNSIRKKSSSPSSSLVFPQQEKHLREETLGSPVTPNIPIACPITTHSTYMNQQQPSLQPWRQLGPYAYGHLAHVRPSEPPVLHPGQMPALNGPSACFSNPGSSYSVAPYWGPGQFRPNAGTGPGDTPAHGQFRPNAGIGPGCTPAFGQFRPPTAGTSPGGNSGEFRPPLPGQFRPTAGNGLGGTPGPGQFRPPTTGIGPAGTYALGYFGKTL